MVEGVEELSGARVGVEKGGDPHGEMGRVPREAVGDAEHELEVLGLLARGQLEHVGQHATNAGNAGLKRNRNILKDTVDDFAWLAGRELVITVAKE